MLRFFALVAIALLLFFGRNTLHAQDINKIIKKGIKELDNKQDIKAYNYFLDALYLEPENKTAKLYAGICHLHLQSPKKALEYLLSVKDSEESKQVPEYTIFLAMAYHLNEDFSNAEKTINEIQDSVFSEKVNLSLTKNYITNAKTTFGKESKLTVQNMGESINTSQHEYGIAAFADHHTLLYTSRPDLWDQDTLKNKTYKYENIFLVELDSNYYWDKPNYFTNPDLHGNDAIIQVFNNDQNLLIYQNGDLYIADRVDDYWEKGKLIREIATPGNESHGFMADNGSTLYFASNFDSHDGTLDLYVTKLDEEGEWSEPQPLLGLNSPYDEDSPFLADDGYLYFSSKGHSSIGNFDIFRSRYIDSLQQWEEPENLGYPVNSVFDDIYYTKYGRLSYFSSLRPGGNGGMDLYRVLPFDAILIEGTLTDEESGELITNSKKTLKFDKEVFEVSTDDEGKYVLEMPITSDTYFHIENVANSSEQNIVFHFGDTTQPQKFLAVPLISDGKNIPIAKFDTHPDNLSVQEQKELQNKAKTDSISTEENIQQDSVSEENVVTEELITKSEEENIIDDNNTDIAENTVESTESLNGDENVIVQSEENIQPNVDNISLNQEKSFENNPTIANLKNGKSSNLFLYFDSNAAMINEVFYAGLDEIADYLIQEKDFIIEIGGHTDNVGSEYYNKELSERRAKSIALYLIERGVDKSRIIATGYGESQPIASNDDEKDGRELNRRVEIKKVSSPQVSTVHE
ncbi:MAG: hypothetical protein CMO01_27045 [Thalassobius sp.]|nr:hypothetical protein [Thalassovita sp.]